MIIFCRLKLYSGRKRGNERQSIGSDAIKTAKDCCDKADMAAKKTEAAADRAEDAAAKAVKAFELEQQK